MEDLLPIDLSLNQVGLQLLTGASSASDGELYLDIYDLSLTWSTPTGDVPDTTPLGGNLSDWFSLVKEETGGGVARVYFPQGENEALVAFKKSLSQLVAFGGGVERGGVEREVEAGGIHVVRGSGLVSQRQGTVRTDKVHMCVFRALACDVMVA